MIAERQDYKAFVMERSGVEFKVRSSIYVDEDVFADELEQIFERTWIYVGHASEIPEPGDYRLSTIGRIPAIMSRGDDGTIHVLLNVCLHRAATICNESRGKARTFVCPYHRWVYALDGELLGVTDEPGYPTGWRERMGSLKRPAEVGSFHGMIFARLRAGDESLETFLAPLAQHLDTWFSQSPFKRVQVQRPTMARYPANWKFQVENTTDGLHARYVHAGALRVLERFGLRDRQRVLLGAQRGFANGHGIIDRPLRRVFSAEAMAEYRAILSAAYGSERAEHVSDYGGQITIFPNLQLMEHRFRVIQPVSVSETIVHEFPVEFEGIPAAINEEIRGRFTQEGGAMVGGFVNTDDVEVFTRIQTGLQASRYLEWIDFSRGIGRDVSVSPDEWSSEASYELSQRTYYREWCRRMSAA